MYANKYRISDKIRRVNEMADSMTKNIFLGFSYSYNLEPSTTFSKKKKFIFYVCFLVLLFHFANL